jgi:hypothetical protein
MWLCLGGGGGGGVAAFVGVVLTLFFPSVFLRDEGAGADHSQ